MTNLIFKFDRERDLYNVWETCNKESRFYDFKKNIPKQVVDLCAGKKFEECKDELALKYKRVHNSFFIEEFVKSLNLMWAKINNEFFRRLEKIMKKPICSEEFTAYLTSIGRCPYNPEESSFMISLFNGIPYMFQTAGHEIMHMQFHKYYWDNVEKKIGKEKTSDLKEALTVLLNIEFKDLFLAEDKGYDIHKELRGFIEKSWKEDKDFDKLLEKCVKFLE